MLLKVYFGKKIHFIQYFLRIFWKMFISSCAFKVYFGSPFYPVLLRYILEKGPFNAVLFKVYIGKKDPFHPVLFEVYFGRRSILSSTFIK